MKNLLDTKVKRGEELKEWIPADSHLTVAGLIAFMERQRKRREAVLVITRKRVKS